MARLPYEGSLRGIRRIWLPDCDAVGRFLAVRHIQAVGLRGRTICFMSFAQLGWTGAVELTQGVGMAFEQDIQEIAAVMGGRDPAFAPVSVKTREAALHALQGIENRDEFILAAMRAVALGRNAHSRVIPNAIAKCVPHRIVVRDGAPMMVVDGDMHRIEAVCGATPDRLLSKWVPLLAGNAVRQRMLSCLMLAWPAALSWAGLGASDGVSYELAGRPSLRCAPETVVPALSLFPVSDTGAVLAGADAHELPGGALAHWQDGVWRVRICDLKALDQTQIVGIVDTVATRDTAGIVVDLRGNPGGDFTKVVPLVNWLQSDWRGVACAVLVNGYTFSAAIVAAVLISHALGPRAHVFGSGMGDDLRFWAEGDMVALPQSGATLRYSTGWHDWITGLPDATTPAEVACHLVAAGEVPVTPVPDARQDAVAFAFASGR
jgi:hypothetical protein